MAGLTDDGMNPHKDPDYVASLHALAKERGLDPRVFQSVRMADPRCDDCKTPAPRYFCRACEVDEIAPGVQARRCQGCDIVHAQAVHGIAPLEVTCLFCKVQFKVVPPGAQTPVCEECQALRRAGL